MVILQVWGRFYLKDRAVPTVFFAILFPETGEEEDTAQTVLIPAVSRHIMKRNKRLLCIIILLALALGAGLPVSEHTAYAGSIGSPQGAAIQADESVSYRIVSVKNGLVLDVSGETLYSKPGSNIQVYQKGEETNLSQQFYIRSTQEGWYVILCAANLSLAVNPRSDSPAAGTNIDAYRAAEHDRTQGWYLRREGDAVVICSAWNESLVLTSVGDGNRSNVCLSQYLPGNQSQLWRLEAAGKPVPAQSGQVYRAYRELIRQREDTFGSLYGKSMSYLPSMLSSCGLCYAGLIDMDGDGLEELVLVTNQGTAYNDYVVEIWCASGGALRQLYSGPVLLGGDAGSESLVFSCLDGRNLFLAGTSAAEDAYVAYGKRGDYLEAAYNVVSDPFTGKYTVNGMAEPNPGAASRLLFDNLSLDMGFADWTDDGEYIRRSRSLIRQTKDRLAMREAGSGRLPDTDLTAMLNGYASILRNLERGPDPHFALAYIDEDAYPELLITGAVDYHLEGVSVYTWYNSQVVYLGDYGAYTSVEYAPGENALRCRDMSMGIEYETYWRIRKGAVDCFADSHQIGEGGYGQPMIENGTSDRDTVAVYRRVIASQFSGFKTYQWDKGYSITETVLADLIQNCGRYFAK